MNTLSGVVLAALCLLTFSCTPPPSRVGPDARKKSDDSQEKYGGNKKDPSDKPIVVPSDKDEGKKPVPEDDPLKGDDGKPIPTDPVIEDNPEADLGLQAQAILDRSCVACHSPNNAQGNFGTLGNVQEMINSGRYIIPGEPSKSLLYTRMAPGGNMPPAGPLAAKDIDTVSRWIASLQPTQNDLVSESEILKSIRADLEKISSRQRSRIRYFTLHVPNNLNASIATLDNLRLAFRKVINSLSHSNSVIVPTPIDEKKLVYRIDLNQFNLAAETFNQIMSDFYPLTRVFDTNTGFSRADSENNTFMKNAVGSEHYLIRLDWFVATAALPIPYARFLDLGVDQQALDKSLGIDMVDNIKSFDVIRAGFRNSGVSSQNRVIERHSQTKDFKDLGYWISYDFGSNEDKANIFLNPLGPVGALESNKIFQHDGGEIIFQLPNGLFGYYLSNAKGVAIDKGPLNIVHQVDAPPQFLTAIVNGISCMNCHNAGFLYKKDEIEEFASNSRNTFSNSELGLVRRLYPAENVFKDAMDKDNDIYFTAIRALGVDPAKPDPVNLAYRFYNRAMTRNDVIAELGFTESKFNSLMTSEPFRSRWSNLTSENGFIKREDFNTLFGSLKAVAKTASFVPPALGDMVITTNCMFANQLQMDDCLLK